MGDHSGGCWEYFDKIFCISLEDRVDRREEATSQFESVGLLGHVEFVLVKRDPRNSERGIYESHILCMQKALDAGAGSILIFEDDIIFDRLSRDVLNNSISFMQSNNDWTMFFLGCLVKKIKKTTKPSVVGIEYGSLTHAYAVTSETAERIVGKKWVGQAYDMMLRGMGGNNFAAYPSFAFQSNSATDNYNHPGLDRFRRLLGGFKRVQKFNELYNRHKGFIVFVHVVLVLLILLWMTGVLR